MRPVIYDYEEVPISMDWHIIHGCRGSIGEMQHIQFCAVKVVGSITPGLHKCSAHPVIGDRICSTEGFLNP